MNPPRLRPPVVAGWFPRIGTTTLARALHGVDGGVVRSRADVLLGPPGELLPDAPVLVLACGAGVDAADGAHVLPRVSAWADAAEIPADVPELLTRPADAVPEPLRAYAAVLRRITAALLRSGTLERPDPPRLSGVLWHGLRSAR